jgi:hypothetical protein
MMKVVSWFSRLLHHLPRAKFSHLVVKHQAERRRRDLPAGPNCWQCSFVTWPVPTLRSFLKRSNSNLKVKTFIGTRENALRIQIWTALIALLLLKYLRHLSRFGWSSSNLATMLRLNLFTYRDLMTWLHDTFGQPPLPPVIQFRPFGFGQRVAGIR